MFDKFIRWYDSQRDSARWWLFVAYVIICNGALYTPYLVLNVIGIVMAIPLIVVAVCIILK